MSRLAGDDHQVLAEPSADESIQPAADRENEGVVKANAAGVDDTRVAANQLVGERRKEPETVGVTAQGDLETGTAHPFLELPAPVAAEMADLPVHRAVQQVERRHVKQQL